MANWTWFHRLGSPPWLLATINRWLPWLMLFCFVLLAVSAVWGLAFAPVDYKQGNSYRIIYLHVPAAIVSLAGYYAMALAGAVHLIWRMKVADIALRSIAPVGAAMTFLALATGGIWGKPTWGAWWVWDARVTSMTVLLFLYIGIIALHDAFRGSESGGRAAAILSLVGTVNIPIIYKSVDWWFSLHQPATIKFTEESTIATSMLQPLVLSIVAFYLLFFLAVLLQMRTRIAHSERKSAWLARLASGKST